MFDFFPFFVSSAISVYSTMEKQKKEHENSITGYLHNVSPILTSNKTKYFDMQIQTGEDEVKHGVCFSPPRIDEFNKHSKSKSPGC